MAAIFLANSMMRKSSLGEQDGAMTDEYITVRDWHRKPVSRAWLKIKDPAIPVAHADRVRRACGVCLTLVADVLSGPLEQAASGTAKDPIPRHLALGASEAKQLKSAALQRGRAQGTCHQLQDLRATIASRIVFEFGNDDPPASKAPE
jgi:hypothetical protein